MKLPKIPLVLRAFNSPFKIPKLIWYFGKTAIGTPIFFPRKWVKYKTKDAIESAVTAINNPRLVQKSFEEWVEYYKNYKKAVPLKIGFTFTDIYWKTKWNSTDYRFEYDATWSFVFFGYQIALRFKVPHQDHYWECFLFYHYDTDREAPIKERITKCKKEFPCIWTTTTNRISIQTDYYDLILKPKYL